MMTQDEVTLELERLMAQLDDMGRKADRLIEEIDARPFQTMCREKGTTPAEVLAGLEEKMSVEELHEAQNARRQMMRECEEHVRRELGLSEPAAQKTVRRGPRRMI